MFLFDPFLQQRTWGERQLERTFHRLLPDDGLPYGESWEISDRPGANSIVRHCTYGKEFVGLSLHVLWENFREKIFGKGFENCGDFPLLCKILDCHDILSLQVHPPEAVAKKLGASPKTEMWYVAGVTQPQAQLYAGLRQKMTTSQVRSAINSGNFTDYIQTFTPQVGDSIFIPSGCPHAIGAGLLIFEIQQNSDTTYRVYDWGRLDKITGKPRQLHREESILSINPNVSFPKLRKASPGVLVDCPEFCVEQINLRDGEEVGLKNPERFAIFVVAEGSVALPDGVVCSIGTFILAPVYSLPLRAIGEKSAILRVTCG